MSVITSLGSEAENNASLAREVTDYTEAQMPAEKEQAERDLAATGRALAAMGPQATTEGLGQVVGSIPMRIYMRWDNLYPGCWRDRSFVNEFLKDNPQCCGKGYKPKASALRHGFTFIGGAAVYHKHKALVR